MESRKVLPFGDYFHEKASPCHLGYVIAISSKWHKHCIECQLTCYLEVRNYLLETYDTNDIIAGMDAEIVEFKQLSTMTPTLYTDALSNKVSRYNLVYDEHLVKEIFI